MNPWQFYDMLISCADEDAVVEEVLCGVSWSMVRLSDGRIGIAAAQQGLVQPERYRGMKARACAELLKSWCFAEASVGAAALNACLNVSARFPRQENPDAFLRYRDRCMNKRVTVVGHFAYLENRLRGLCDLRILERVPGDGDYPDPACEYLLPETDVAFITASAIANKTMPRLLALSRNAFTVITGPSTPFARKLFASGADALCGFCVTEEGACQSAVRENKGIFSCGRMICLERE